MGDYTEYAGLSYEQASRKIQDIVDKCAKSGACTDEDVLDLFNLAFIRIIETLKMGKSDGKRRQN